MLFYVKSGLFCITFSQQLPVTSLSSIEPVIELFKIMLLRFAGRSFGVGQLITYRGPL